MKKIVFILCFVWITGVLLADDIKPTFIEIILDASNSMNEIINNEKKIDTAKRVLSNLVKQWQEESAGAIQIGLRIYGNNFDPYKTKEEACQDTTLEVPIAENTYQSINTKIFEVEAKGYTPIAYTLTQTKNDFAPGENNVVVLVSDGKESCDGDPCAVAKAYEEKGINLTVHVVGFAVDKETEMQLRCIAEATGGEYYTAENADDLQIVAEKVKMLVSEEISKPKKVSKKIKISGPGKLTFELGAELDNVQLSKILIKKTGTDEVVVSKWKEFFNPIVLAAGKYDIYILHKGSSGPSLYTTNFEIKSGEDQTVHLNTGLSFAISDEETIKGIDRIYIHQMPEDQEVFYTWDQAYLVTPKLIGPGKYRIYFTYRGGSNQKTMIVDDLELNVGDVLELDM